MRRTPKLLTTLAIIGNLISAPLTQALSPSVVQFEGGAEDFVFYTESGVNDDLFDELHEVLPGDDSTQIIKIRNNAPQYDYVKIYLAEVVVPDVPANDEGTVSMREFLSLFKLTIKAGDEIIYSSDGTTLPEMPQNLLLGQYNYQDESEISIQLEAPKTITNRYKHCHVKLNWSFMAEVFENGDKVPYSPNTGGRMTNESGIITGSGIVIAVIVFGGYFYYKKRKLNQ